MHVLILGAAGMIGRKLCAALVRDGLGGAEIQRLTLADVVAPAAAAEFGGEVSTLTLDLSEGGAAPGLVAERPDVIFHLAAIVSGEAEADFDKGYRINLDGTRFLLDAIRAEAGRAPYRPRLIFTSSLAVFGPPLPAKIGDDFFCTPATSYGAQKAMCELMVSDYSRRGVLDGLSLRLPTICIRPGAPNKAASGFFSGIVREPLVGREAVLPVGDDVRHWFASPRAATGFLVHAATLDTSALGARRALNMPGLSATVGDEIEAMRRVAGERAVKLIRREANPQIAEIIAGWPQDFEAQRALALGFRAETSFDEIIRVHIEDELGGALPG